MRKKKDKEPELIKKSQTCANCHSIFYGDTHAEAQARLAGHHCPKAIGMPSERKRTH